MRKGLARTREALLIFGLVCALAVGVQASSILSPTFFTSRDAWQAALGGPPSLTVNFDNAGRAGGLNFDPLRIIVGGDATAVIDNGMINASLGAGSFLNFALAQPITALGFDVVSTNGLMNFSIGGTDLRLSQGFFGVIGAPGSTFNFGSFMFNGTSIILTAQDASLASFLIDNVSIQAVPEPQTLGLLAIGLGVGAQVYRRRRQAERESAAPRGGEPDSK